MEYPEDAYVIWYNTIQMAEYDTKMIFKIKPVILDIGANVGFFTLWAIHKWNPSKIYCYEPLSSNFEYLEKNMKNLPIQTTEIILNHIAVEAPTNKLYFGLTNCGQSSFVQLNCCTKEFEESKSISAKTLPNCDILKIDTEGCEKEILINYLEREHRPGLVLYEYHTDADRRFLDTFMYDKGYMLIGGQIDSERWGIMKFAHNKVPYVPKEK